MMKFKDRLISKFQDTGECEVYVDKVVKTWNEKTFAISQYQEEYTLIKYRLNSASTRLKCKISEAQAKEIIEKLHLAKIVNSMFRSASTYRSREHVISEIIRLAKIEAKKIEELSFLTRCKAEFQMALK